MQVIIMKKFFRSDKSLRRSWITYLFFVLSVVYCETVFRFATIGGVFSLSMLYVALFSAVGGGMLFLLSTLSKKRKINHILGTLLLSLVSLTFTVEYFVFRSFKVFYDLNTVVGGAGGVAGDFLGDVLKLIFSLRGIGMMLLFFLPPLSYACLAKLFRLRSAANTKGRLRIAATSLICYLLCLGMILVNGAVRPSYHNEHDFATAIGNFGLLTGIRLDVQHMLFGHSGGFESQSPSTPSDVVAPIEYGENKMELNLTKPASSAVQELNDYVSSLTPTKKNAYTGLFKGKNLIMISAEAFTAEVIDPQLTPTLYRLATKGINFKDHYQPSTAGTTGGEYQNVFSMLPTEGGMSFKDTADNNNYFTMGSQLNRLGYYGKAFHNNSYTYYDRNKTHVNLGYSDGFMGYGNGMEQYLKKCWPQSDLEMMAGTLPTYIDKQPFNVYYMSVSGHSAYSRGGNSMTAKNWDRVAHLPYSDPVKGYLAANLELEDAMTHLVAQLEAKGIADDTVICLSTDHFPYGLDEGGSLGNMPYLSELYGYSVNTLFQRDHSALILWCGSLEASQPIVIDTPTSSLDILPTLSNLFGTEFDSRLMVGRDVFSDAEALVFNLNYSWKTALGTYENGKFTPATPDTQIPDGYVDRIKTVVRNKIRYCDGALNQDYFDYLFS